MLRVLRPLRFVNKINSLKVIISALVASVAEIVYVFILTMVGFFIFALIGLEFYRSLSLALAVLCPPPPPAGGV